MSPTTSAAFTASSTTSDSSSDNAPPIVVVKSDIRSASRAAILALAAKQIQIDKKLESKQIITEDEDDDKERQTEDEEIDAWEESETDSDGETDSDSEDSDFDDGLDKREDTRLLKGYIFGIEELFLLEENLGSWGGFLLKFDLLNGELLVRTVPGLLHKTTAQYFTTELRLWSNIPGKKDWT